jgi:hypothetical protein
VVYRPAIRQRPRKNQRDNSRCYATARQTCLYNNRVTLRNGVMQPITRQLQRLDDNNGNGIYSMRSVTRKYLDNNWGDPISRRQPAGIWVCEQRNWTKSSLRNWQLQNNSKKGNRLWKEVVMCDLKWQWECYKSVARIRLVKTEEPSACVTVSVDQQ